MTLKKRGLGRGLEELLAGTPQLMDEQLASLDSEGLRLVFEQLRQDRLTLLQEAQALQQLLNEMDAIIRATHS